MVSLQNAINAYLMPMAFSVSIDSVGITASDGQKDFSETRRIPLKIHVEIDVLLQNAINTTDAFEQSTSATYPVTRASVTWDKPASAGAARGKHSDCAKCRCQSSKYMYSVSCCRCFVAATFALPFCSFRIFFFVAVFFFFAFETAKGSMLEASGMDAACWQFYCCC